MNGHFISLRLLVNLKHHTDAALWLHNLAEALSVNANYHAKCLKMPTGLISIHYCPTFVIVAE